MFCSKCGAKLREGAIFCKDCGEKLKGTKEHVVERQILSSSGGADIHPNAFPLKRFLNFVIDYVAIYILSYALGYVLASIDNNFAYQEDSVYYIVSALILVLYYSCSEYWWGKTLGKFVTKTRVVLNEEGAVDYWTALKRSLIRLIPFEFFSLDNKTRMLWHDRWTNTRVADETKFVDPGEVEVLPIVRTPWVYGLLKKIATFTLSAIIISGFLALLLGKDGAAIFNFVLGITGVLGLIWTLFGLPVGLIDLARRSGANSYDGRHNAAVLLGGLVILGIVFSAYALVYIIWSLLGIDLVSVS